jgi:hypothetical protein
MPNLTVTIAAEIVSIDVTGSECDGCGETPWLNAFAIVAVVNGEASNEVLAYLCPDCVEMIRENAKQRDQ